MKNIVSKIKKYFIRLFYAIINVKQYEIPLTNEEELYGFLEENKERIKELIFFQTPHAGLFQGEYDKRIKSPTTISKKLPTKKRVNYPPSNKLGELITKDKELWNGFNTRNKITIDVLRKDYEDIVNKKLKLNKK